MSDRLTWLDVERLNAKVLAAKMKREGKMPPEPEPYDEPEEKICQKIIAEIQRRRWYYTRNIPGRRQTATVGTTDFIIAAPAKCATPYDSQIFIGRTFWIEVKRKGGKLTQEQTVTKHLLVDLGQRYACVYSYEEFLAFVDS